MAARTTEKEKRPGFFSQIKNLFIFTKREFSFLPWLLIGIFVLAIAIGILVGFLIQPVQWWNVLLWGITGLMLGLLASMMTLTRFSTKAMYRQLDGKPGAGGHVMGSMLGRRWVSSDMPVGINPKTQDAVYRAVGRGGVVIVGEGAKGRLSRLVNDERSKVTRVASGVPVTVFYIGHGEGEIPIKDLAKTVKGLNKKLSRAQVLQVVKRIDSVSQSITSLPIPKGIDPSKARAQRPR